MSITETAARLREEIEKLHDFILEINAMEDLDRVLDLITEHIKQEFGFEYYWLLFVDEKERRLYTSRIDPSDSVSPEARRKLLGMKIPLGPAGGAIARTCRKRRLLYLPRLNRENISGIDLEIVETVNLSGFLHIPLIVQNRVIAVLTFTNFREGLSLDAERLQSIRRYADQIAGAVYKSLLLKRLREEKGRSDRLLLSILPRDIAEELKQHGTSEPVQVDSVTVLFTDFVGFTKIAGNMTPANLVRELDLCFSYFDRVVERFNLEKLKTIGDAYMCAGGIPSRNSTHPVDAVLAALEIKSIMDQIREIKESQGMPYWTLRLGIHTGPLVAGVIGEKKFAYDIWGDTVNMASRMESHGEPTRINISAGTYEHVREFFECEYRGNIYVKNKGEAEMYFVNGIKPALSRDAAGQVPNEDFQKMYSDLRRGLRPSAPEPVAVPGQNGQHARTNLRLTPGDPRDFSVEFFVEGRPIIARLGNISETGLCLFLGETTPAYGERLEGFILDKNAGERIPFQGEVQWTYRGFLEGNMYLFVGLRFQKPIQFTESMRRLAHGPAAREPGSDRRP